MPSLVESDDQANLKILVDRLQQHLTAHGRGPVDAELTTVYRAASAHLRSGARGYAERVGTPRRPILLGDIAVERKYNVVAPRIDLERARAGLAALGAGDRQRPERRAPQALDRAARHEPRRRSGGASGGSDEARSPPKSRAAAARARGASGSRPARVLLMAARAGARGADDRSRAGRRWLR